MARQGASTWDELEAEEAQGKVQEGYGMALLPPPSTSKSSKNRRPRVRQSLYAEACATRMVQGVKIRQFYIEAGNYSAGNWHRKSGHLSRKCNSRQGAIDELAVLMQQEFWVKGVHKTSFHTSLTTCIMTCAIALVPRLIRTCLSKSILPRHTLMWRMGTLRYHCHFSVLTSRLKKGYVIRYRGVRAH